jgi:predicted dehydrogenase
LRNVGLSTEVDTYGKYVIGFSSGVLYHIETSWISPVPEPRWYVLGSEGAVLKATPSPDEPAQIVRRTDDGTNESTVDCIHTGGHGAFYDNLYEALANGARSAVLPEEGALVTRVIEAVRESSRTGKAVRL